MCGNSSEENKRRYERGEVGNIKEGRKKHMSTRTSTTRYVEVVLKRIRGGIKEVK